MQKEFFRRPFLEQLESRELLNMFFGQIGTPGSGFTSVNLDNPHLDSSALIASNSVEQNFENILAAKETNHSAVAVPSPLLSEAGFTHSVNTPITTNNADDKRIGSNRGNISFDTFSQDAFGLEFSTGLESPFGEAGNANVGISKSSNALFSGAMQATSSDSSAPITTQGGASTSNAAGTFQPAATSQSPPMILLPSNHNGSSLMAASSKNLPGSTQVNPSFTSQPNTFTGFIVLSAPQYVPVNADDDNKSPLAKDANQNTIPGIPTKRDFNVTVDVNGNQFNDPELLPGSVSLNDLNGGGWAMSITYSGNGRITLWTDAKKSAEFTIPAGWPGGNFYIEGTHESSKLNDIDLQFTYTINGIKHIADALITVTPLIQSFGVATPAGQSVNFTNGIDGSLGLKATDNNGNASAQFKGVLDVHALKANDLAQFIQNIQGENNGDNGTKDNNGKPVGWLYQNLIGWVSKPLQVNPQTQQNSQFPLLDVNPTDTAPTYRYANNYNLNLANSVGTLTAADIPKSGNPGSYGGPPGNTGVAVDDTVFFMLYLVWQYNNNGPDGKTSVYYPIAFTTWNVIFFATAGGANGVKVPPYGKPPINFIQNKNGVTSQGANNYTPSNEVPSQMVISAWTIYNGNVGWAQA
jgi:hypothetical protein